MSVSNPIEACLGGEAAPRRSPAGRLGRWVGALTSHRCLIPLCTANALGCIVVAVAYLGSLDGVLDTRGQVVTGDFLNFYNGGRMILTGQGPALFDVEAQRASLERIAGADYPNLHWYNYPPTWAVALAPICALPYVWAFYAYDLLMAAAMVATLCLLRPWLPELGKRWYVVVLAVVFFHPIIRNIIGGQNTVLTTFLMAGTYASLRGNRRVLAGVYLGLLLYKPQYALPLGLVLLLGGRWVTVASAGAVGVGHYLVGAVFCGA
ncbi:MAG: DUF2029 domain-containing protein, partial [bacterium]|nr:DUF2029 domain-containing protein [bacterium]